MNHKTTTKKADIPYIGMKSLIVMHILLALFILLVHWKLSILPGF